MYKDVMLILIMIELTSISCQETTEGVKEDDV